MTEQDKRLLKSVLRFYQTILHDANVTIERYLAEDTLTTEGSVDYILQYVEKQAAIIRDNLKELKK